MIATLGTGAANRAIEMTQAGIWVEIERSAQEEGPKLVEPRMVQIEWDWLVDHGTLTNVTLLRDLRIHRSSFVCALLAPLPGVRVVISRPITLTVERAGERPHNWST